MVDPISVIIAALAAGVVFGVFDTAGTAVKDSYTALKTLIKKKFEGEPKSQMVLEEHETDPETYETPLKKKLAEAGIDKDEAILKAAQDLLKQEKPEEFKAGKFNTQIAGDFKGIQGDISGGTISQTFN